jgi:DNA-binding ferritin-like protein
VVVPASTGTIRAENAQQQAEKAQLQAEQERDALAERLRALGHPPAEE